MNDKCDRCGKSMLFHEGQRDELYFSGIELSIDYGTCHGKKAKFMKDQMGKYAPKDLNGTGMKYRFCWECWIDSLLGRGND